MSRLRLGLLGLALLAGLVTFFVSVPTHAQKDGPAPRGYLPPNWKKIGLADEQVKTIYRIQAGYDAKIDALKQQIADLKKQEKVELEAVLTPTQKERLRAILLGTLDKDKAPGKDSAPPKDSPKDK